MIEVIYDKDNNENDKTESEKSDGVKMPKNIRQIGTPNPNKRIYIEDYVVTYLNYISRPGSTHARGAILLGEVRNTDAGMVIFISGAVDAQNIEFDLGEDTFSREIWTDIYKEIKDNFPELIIVGWFLSRMGFTTALNEKITKLHIDNFPGKDKVLYMYDSLDDDDAFYLFEKGELKKQKGYYIYYSKNEAMQAYIMKQKGDISEEEGSEINTKDKTLLKNFRDKNQKYEKNEKKSGGNLAYIASSFVVVALLAIGITVVNNYDKMKNMEVSLNRLELTSSDDGVSTEISAPAAVIEPNDASDGDAASENEQEENEQNNDTAEEITTEMVDSKEKISTEQTIPTMNENDKKVYIVKSGDTLTSISKEMYNSAKYIYDIADANEMNIEDKIFEGQELIIPSVD